MNHFDPCIRLIVISLFPMLKAAKALGRECRRGWDWNTSGFAAPEAPAFSQADLFCRLATLGLCYPGFKKPASSGSPGTDHSGDE